MQIEVNGTRLWFDVDGPVLVPDGSAMRTRPTLILIHGGPGSYDHSYFKPYFARLADHAQVIYLDLRDHGRSAWGDPAQWTFQRCADDLRAFCDVLGIARPVALGHSMGGFVAMLYAARHPGHPGGLILQSTMARFDLERLVAGFRQVAGDEIADLARRDYAGEGVSDDEWATVASAFGPVVPNQAEVARRQRNEALAVVGMQAFRRLDVVGELARITCPTLVCVGDVDPVTPVGASLEIVAGLSSVVARLEVMEGVGHFPWLEAPDRYESLIRSFVQAVGPPLDMERPPD